MTRRPIAAGNWKMNLRAGEARRLCRALREAVGSGGPEVVIFPPHPFVAPAAEILQGSPVAVGGQDLHPEPFGAHTGDVSGLHLADVGATWVLAGHSERRHDHGESDEVVGAKVARAAACGLSSILCVGETRDERRAGKTLEVLHRQIEAGIAAAPERFVVAYEPVWAIGTGDTATPEQAQEAHAEIRSFLVELRGGETAAGTRILYGGSVKPHNAGELAAEPDIDGFLVGGASLDSAPFLDIIGSLRPNGDSP